jgi:2-polyprenyl-3-methyl-5-hydroxy-6-metoxy-1,4-benzoquinol methylase
MFKPVMRPAAASPLESCPGCPLCGAPQAGREIARIPYRAIWDALALEWEVRPAREVVARLTPGDTAFLRECARCGLQYFTPARAGDGAFYESLATSPRYYSSWKWEFGWVCDRLASGAAVLDVGCGAGDFLAAAALRGGRAVGLEQSAAAARAARARGLQVSEEPLEDFSRAHRREFDAVCLFHVLEHLESVRPFLRTLLDCLRPGGSLFLSLPNRDRTFRQPLEPLDCPPHHLTRWSSRQIGWLAASLGLRLVEISREPVDVMQMRGEVARRLRVRLEGIPGAGPALGRWSNRILVRTLLHPSICRLGGRTGVFDRLGMRGMAIAARCVLGAEAA